MFSTCWARSTRAPGRFGAAASGRLSPSEPTSTVSVAASPGAIRSGSSLAWIESFPVGDVFARAAPWRIASVSAAASAALPVTVPVLLTRLPFVLPAVRATLGLQRLEPVLRFLLGEGAGA